MVDTLKIYERYFPDEITPQGFIGHMLRYIQELLSDNAPAAKIDEYLEKYGLTSEKALKELLDNRILKRTEKIRKDIDGRDVFYIKYKPNEGINIKQALRNLYIQTFENHMVDNDKFLKEEDGGYAGTNGATSAADVNDTAPIMPLKIKNAKGETEEPIIRRTFAEGKKRTIIITNKQKKYLEEVTSIMSVGGGVDGNVEGGNSYAYDAPAFVDAETADHQNIMRKSWRG